MVYTQLVCESNFIGWLTPCVANILGNYIGVWLILGWMLYLWNLKQSLGYCTHHFQNPYIFSSKLARRIICGLNLTHLIFIVLHNQQQSFDIECAPNGIGIILAGRMKGHMKTRFVPKMNALSLRSFTNRIIDIGMKV